MAGNKVRKSKQPLTEINASLFQTRARMETRNVRKEETATSIVQCYSWVRKHYTVSSRLEPDLLC